MRVNLKDHAIGACIVSFVAAVATVLMAYMARIGPPIFEYLMLGLGAFALLSLAAGLVMGAVVLLKPASS